MPPDEMMPPPGNETGMGAPVPPMPAAGAMEMCVSTDALAMPDEQEQMEPPAVGDTVSFTVEGKVSRVEGGNSYVTPEMVNGKPVAAEAGEAAPPDDMGGLTEMAGQMDEASA